MDEFEQNHEGQEQPVVVEAKPLEPQKIDEKSIASSDLPYHSKETEKIADDRKDDVVSTGPKDFTYTANGYEVKAVEAEDYQKGFADEDGLVYEVKQGDMVKVFGNKQQAIIFAQTHAPEFASSTDPTMPSA